MESQKSAQIFRVLSTIVAVVHRDGFMVDENSFETTAQAVEWLYENHSDCQKLSVDTLRETIRCQDFSK